MLCNSQPRAQSWWWCLLFTKIGWKYIHPWLLTTGSECTMQIFTAVCGFRWQNVTALLFLRFLHTILHRVGREPWSVLIPQLNQIMRVGASDDDWWAEDSSNLTDFQPYTLPTLHSNNITLFLSTLLQYCTLPIIHSPIWQFEKVWQQPTTNNQQCRH